MCPRRWKQLRSEHEKQSEESRRVNMLLSEHNQREEILKNTLVAAQRTSEELKENARKQSPLLLKEAELAADRLVEAAQARAHEIEKDIVELKMQKRQVLNSILAAIANLRNLIQLMSESEAQQDKLSFLKRKTEPQWTRKQVAQKLIATRIADPKRACSLRRSR